MLKTGAAFTDVFLVAAEKNSASQPTEIGLCFDCEHMRRIVSERGSAFFLCSRALNEPEFPQESAPSCAKRSVQQRSQELAVHGHSVVLVALPGIEPGFED